MQKLIKLYKPFSIAGLIFCILLFTIGIMQKTDPNRGTSFFDGTIIIVFEIICFVLFISFFILCFKANKQITEGYLSKKLYLSIIIIGIINIQLPSFLFSLWILSKINTLKPGSFDEAVMPYVRFCMDITNYSKILIQCENGLLVAIAILTIVLVVFSIILKNGFNKTTVN